MLKKLDNLKLGKAVVHPIIIVLKNSGLSMTFVIRILVSNQN